MKIILYLGIILILVEGLRGAILLVKSFALTMFLDEHGKDLEDNLPLLINLKKKRRKINKKLLLALLFFALGLTILIWI